jgi:hypothetical protein
MAKKDPSLTSSYKPPKSAKKIPKGDKGFEIVDKAFKQSNEAETGSYIPPQSPIAIQPGDKGFEIVGKAYNKWLWTFPEWKKKPSKIINPSANWGLNAKPMTQAQIKKKMKHLYLKEEFDFANSLEGGQGDGLTLLDLVKKHDSKGYYDVSNYLDFLTRQLVDGVFVEIEHTKDPQQAREIAMDHLHEDPNYYIKLKKIELN